MATPYPWPGRKPHIRFRADADFRHLRRRATIFLRHEGIDGAEAARVERGRLAHRLHRRNGYPEMKILNDAEPGPSSVPDSLINWTTAAALVAVGGILSSEGVILGRTLLALGILSGASRLLRLRAVRTGLHGGYQWFRFVLAVVYVVLLSVAFLVYVFLSKMPLFLIY
jgi:hypothetical protein